MSIYKTIISNDGVVHAAGNDITLCLQHVTDINNKIDTPVSCEACIKKAQFLMINFEEVERKESNRVENDSLEPIMSKLKAYEESGLTPEEVKRLATLKREGKLYIKGTPKEKSSKTA